MKKILIVVPARSGSKGLIHKNMQLIGEHSLIGHVGIIASKLNFNFDIVISTDSDDYGAEAVRYGMKYIFKRPDSISGDQIGDVDVLKHALHETEQILSTEYEFVMMLQPTSPMRKVEEVHAVYNLAVNSTYDSVWTVSMIDNKYHPLKLLEIHNDELKYYDERGKKIIARQQLDNLYLRNGVAYAIKKETLLNQNSIFGKSCGFVICNDNHISIDTISDLDYVRYIYERNKCVE